MSDESSGLGQRAKSLVESAKQSVGAGETPLATKVGGRAEAVEEALKAFGEGDIDRFLEAFSDDVTWSGPKGENFPGAGNHDGRDAVRDAFVGDVKRSFASFGFRPDHFFGAPDADIVVAVGAFTGEGVKGSKGQLDAPAVQMWEFDGDKVVAVDIYTDSADFPGVVTEQEEQEREQEEKEGNGEGESKDSSDSKDSSGETDSSSETKDSDGKDSSETQDSSGEKDSSETRGSAEDSSGEKDSSSETRGSSGDDDSSDSSERDRSDEARSSSSSDG
jgi:ketosteroid isomerase-like protein